MRQKAMVLVFCLFGCFPLHAEKVADLTNVMEPASIRIEGTSAYIPDRSTIHFYTLEPFAHNKSFGARGEGPGELNMRGFVPFNNVYDVHEGFIYYLIYNDDTSLWELHRSEAYEKGVDS